MGLPDESTKDLPFSIFTTSGYSDSCKKRKSTIRFSGSTDFSSKPAKLPKKCVLPQESFKFTVLRTLAFLFGFVGRPFYSTIMLIYANFSANIFLFILGPGLVLNMIPIVISLNSESKFGMVFAMVIEVLLMGCSAHLSFTLYVNYTDYLEDPLHDGHYAGMKRYHVSDLVPLSLTLLLSLTFQFLFLILLFHWLRGSPIFPKNPNRLTFKSYRKFEKYFMLISTAVMLLLTCVTICHLFTLENCGHGVRCDRLGFLSTADLHEEAREMDDIRNRNTAVKTVMSYMTFGALDIPFNELPMKSGLGFRENKLDMLEIREHNELHQKNIRLGPVF